MDGGFEGSRPDVERESVQQDSVVVGKEGQLSNELVNRSPSRVKPGGRMRSMVMMGVMAGLLMGYPSKGSAGERYVNNAPMADSGERTGKAGNEMKSSDYIEARGKIIDIVKQHFDEIPMPWNKKAVANNFKENAAEIKKLMATSDEGEREKIQKGLEPKLKSKAADILNSYMSAYENAENKESYKRAALEIMGIVEKHGVRKWEDEFDKLPK